MQRMIFQAEPDLIERLRQRARERRVSNSELVREALREHLGKATPKRVTFLAAGATKDPSISTQASKGQAPSPEWR